MHQPAAIPVLLTLLASTISTNTLDFPHTGLLKRDTQLSYPSPLNFDILCAADSGTTICHDCLDICYQLPDGKTPYTCSGFDNPHCCGTNEPACGMDPTCKNIKGERDVVSALDVVYPTTVTVSAALSATTTKVNPFASETAAAVGGLATVTAEKNPNATGGVGGLKAGIREKIMLVIVVAVMALL